MKVIVVGIDGSEGSAAALRFAVEEARVRGSELRVVCAWHVPPAAYDTGLVQAPLDATEFERIAGSAARRTLEEAGLDVATTILLREGQAAEVLVEEAEGAELLVVGSRGLGGFRGLLLGSVSQQCAQHATCPVVIVPHRDAG
jgi:nucleotide-binding universal stress UspA family protein